MGKVLLVVLLLGVAVYLTVRFFEKRAGGGRGGQPAGPPRPVAPDDDPEFLWRLEKERRKRKKDQTDPGDSGG